jgi:hypothetical protein
MAEPDIAPIKLRSFARLCLNETARTTWDKADFGATFAGIIIPIVVHFVPQWEHALNSVLWEIPVACLASIGLTRLVLSPFLIYRRRDLEARKLEEHLKAKHTEVEIQSVLGEIYAGGAELRTEMINSESQFDAWVTRFNAWREEALDALAEFGLASDYALFQNADASGKSVVVHTDRWMVEVSVYDRLLSQYQEALAEILRSRRRLT